MIQMNNKIFTIELKVKHQFNLIFVCQIANPIKPHNLKN